jgi:hypothetical protein
MDGLSPFNYISSGHAIQVKCLDISLGITKLLHVRVNKWV